MICVTNRDERAANLSRSFAFIVVNFFEKIGNIIDAVRTMTISHFLSISFLFFSSRKKVKIFVRFFSDITFV